MLDWQNARLRSVCKQHTSQKTFSTIEAANNAKTEAQKSVPPSYCQWRLNIIEQFAFRDPLKPDEWHLLTTNPVEIVLSG